MENKTQGGTALVTGATSGIGLELARVFAKNGHNVILSARSADQLQDIAAELQSQYGIQASIIAKDLATPTGAQELYDEVKRTGVQIDYLVNDAGVGVYGRFWETDMQEELDMIQLNAVSLYVLTKLFLPDMIQRGSGKVLQLASVVSKAPNPLQTVYSATKAFIYNLSLGLSQELKDTGVTMTALQPGATDTEFFTNAGADDTKIYRETKLSDPADVAQDGYDALMAGESHVVSGFKNKAEMLMGNLIPDDAIAAKGMKDNQPSDKSISETER